MKKILITILSTLIMFSLTGIPAFADTSSLDTDYSDISFRDWHAAYIQTLSDMDILSGYSDLTFRPQISISKAEFIVGALKSQGHQLPAADSGHWAANYIQKAREMGAIQKDELLETELNDPISRAQAAKITVMVSDPSFVRQENTGQDFAKINDWQNIPQHFQPYVMEALEMGWINGYPDGSFRPMKPVTRAEASVILTNSLGEQTKLKVQTFQTQAEAALKQKQTTEKNSLRDNILATAYDLRGTPYLYGGSTPSGFDCSGFVKYVLAENGISIPRTTSSIFHSTQRISFSQLQPGDLIFFSTFAPGPSHMGIYTGNGQFIHAPSSGRTVSSASIYDPYYWNSRLYGATRFV